MPWGKKKKKEPKNKKLQFTFRYSLPPKLRKKRNLSDKTKEKIFPYLPIKLFNKNGKRTPIIEALLDSGADCLHINRGIADFLSLPKGKIIECSGAGGQYKSFETKIGLKIGRGGRTKTIGIVKAICPLSYTNMPILVGRDPLFQKYKIIFEEYNEKFKLIPK